MSGLFSFLKKKKHVQEQIIDSKQEQQEKENNSLENKEEQLENQKQQDVFETNYHKNDTFINDNSSEKLTIKSQVETSNDELSKEELIVDVNSNADRTIQKFVDFNEKSSSLVNDESVCVEKTQEQNLNIEAPVNESKNSDLDEERKLSFFERLKKTRDNLAFGLSSLIKGRKIDDDLYEELETALLTADLGVDTTLKIIEKLKSEAKLKELHDASLLKRKLNEVLYDILSPCQKPLVIDAKNGPFVILMIGVNGAGKTTTIGKLAQKFTAQGLKVMLAAGDTFRAAAVEQLKEWGKKVNVPVIAQETGSDSASVLFDALQAAKARNTDVLICDTAGRLQNKDNLMAELSKIVRVMKKIDERVPHEVMLVLDGTTGQNALSQAKLFNEAVKITGLTLTKLDGTAKGGVVFALADKYCIPIRYIGIGEKAKDLREFDTKDFVDALVDLKD